MLAGKYRVEQVLGRGGMGIVLSAWHLELDQRVALKFLSAELAESADAAERFRREARAAARIKSEHVVRVLDVGIMDGTVPYMVMEYLEGHDLDDEVSKRGTLPVAEAVDYALQAIEAIAEAHVAGIVHRDLKPGNLFLFRRRDGARMIKVLDFGISKALASSAASADQMVLTATASLIGSPLYMSPEQMQSPRSVDQRTDIWSLGAILYHSLTGQPPYPAENIAQLCSMLLNSMPVPISKFRTDVPPELERIVARCLERNRERRFGNVSELASAMARFASETSLVHVSRAARILSSPGLGGATKTSSSDRRDSDGAGTQSAWDRDQPKPKNRSLKMILRGALGVAAAAGLVWAFWPVDAEPDSRAAASLPKGPTPEAVPAVVEPPPAKALLIEPTAPAESAVLLAPSAAAPAAPSSPSAKMAPRPASVAPVAPVRPRSKPATNAQAKPVPPPSGPAGLTDFGGRR